MVNRRPIYDRGNRTLLGPQIPDAFGEKPLSFRESIHNSSVIRSIAPLSVPATSVRHTDMRRLTTEILSEKCIVRRFRCANFVECTYTNLRYCSVLHTWAIWYSLLLQGYKPIQRVTVLNTVGSCNTVVLLYCNLMGPPSYMRSVVDRNVMRRIFVLFHFTNLCSCTGPNMFQN